MLFPVHTACLTLLEAGSLASCVMYAASFRWVAQWMHISSSDLNYMQQDQRPEKVIRAAIVTFLKPTSRPSNSLNRSQTKQCTVDKSHSQFPTCNIKHSHPRCFMSNLPGPFVQQMPSRPVGLGFFCQPATPCLPQSKAHILSGHLGQKQRTCMLPTSCGRRRAKPPQVQTLSINLIACSAEP